MNVVVTNVYSGESHEFIGNAQTVVAGLMSQFPWYNQPELDADLPRLLHLIGTDQAYTVDVDEEPLHIDDSDELLDKKEGSPLKDNDHVAALDQEGIAPRSKSAFEAARFLVGAGLVSLNQARRALWEHGGDYEAAALSAYGIEVTDETRQALRSVIDVGGLGKAEMLGEAPAPKEIQPALPEGLGTSESIKRAFHEEQVDYVKLGGKHSKGSMIAKDPASNGVWLIKPGAGKNSPAEGVTEVSASQSRREAAFWHVANSWGLSRCIPRCDLLLADGHEWAAMKLLPWSYKSLEDRLRDNEPRSLGLLNELRHQGLLHKWAVLDFVLGNPDRHGQNAMVDEDYTKCMLIDHGSAFAGQSFDPAHDHNSFIPFYLRAWAYKMNWNELDAEGKLIRMPTVNSETDKLVGAWLNEIHADELELLLHRYGIDPKPELERLGKVKRAYLALGVRGINELWAVT